MTARRKRFESSTIETDEASAAIFRHRPSNDGCVDRDSTQTITERENSWWFEMVDLGDALAKARLRTQYPGANEREIFLRAAALNLGRDLMIEVYSWDPDEHRD